MGKLKCGRPFCSGDLTEVKYYLWYKVECESCGMVGPLANTIKEANTLWDEQSKLIRERVNQVLLNALKPYRGFVNNEEILKKILETLEGAISQGITTASEPYTKPTLLFLVERPSAGWDEAKGFVVRTYTEEDARRIASENAGDEGIEPWLNPGESTCEVITLVGDEMVIQRNFIYGA